jgi:hypothetical protein
MDTYLSHISAALAWKIPLFHVVMGYPSNEDLENALFVEQRTSPSESNRQRLVTVQSHVDSLSLPKGAVVKREGQRIASPELVFLELAQGLGFHRAVLLGLQLCSSAVGGEPITTVAKIRKLLDKTERHRGHKAAVQAAKYLADGSASVMESLLYMFFVLPNMFGGYGLNGAVFNHEISVENKNTSLTNKRVFADLYWSKARLVVEYDSYEHHGSVDSWVKDTRRLAAIERLGYKTLSVTTAQLYSVKALEEVAAVIAAHLGKRARIRTRRFADEHADLRELLPRTMKRS